mmetsp:Transcript_115460/g.358718  ORF Transcript_115460/g.358718 Transcript_115460/m.358718 type:complete len:425 (-) Transcript_115460:371-1645(-)
MGCSGRPHDALGPWLGLGLGPRARPGVLGRGPRLPRLGPGPGAGLLEGRLHGLRSRLRLGLGLGLRLGHLDLLNVALVTVDREFWVFHGEGDLLPLHVDAVDAHALDHVALLELRLQVLGHRQQAHPRDADVHDDAPRRDPDHDAVGDLADLDVLERDKPVVVLLRLWGWRQSLGLRHRLGLRLGLRRRRGRLRLGPGLRHGDRLAGLGPNVSLGRRPLGAEGEGRLLLVRRHGDPLALVVHLGDDHALHLLAHGVLVGDPLRCPEPRVLDSADVHEDAVRGDVLHEAVDERALLEVLDGRPLRVQLLYQALLVLHGERDAAPLHVHHLYRAVADGIANLDVPRQGPADVEPAVLHGAEVDEDPEAVHAGDRALHQRTLLHLLQRHALRVLVVPALANVRSPPAVTPGCALAAGARARARHQLF